MDEKIKEKADEATQKLIAERKARRERHDELKCKIEENEGILDRKRIAINDMHMRYMHGLVDLTFFAGRAATSTRADHERNALHKIVDEITAGRKEYDAGVEANEKLVAEANKLCEEIEKDESEPMPMASFVGGLLGGAAAHLFGRALNTPEKKETTPTEPAPPPSSG